MELHTAYKLMELPASLCECMQVYVTTYMQAHGPAYKLMDLHAISFYCLQAHVMPWKIGEPWKTLGNLG